MAEPRTVLVTGGARRIGAAIVRALAVAGHDVVIHHHHGDDADAEALAGELRATGACIGTVSGDLADAGALRHLFKAARKAGGGVIDGLVNNVSQFEFDRPPAFAPDLLIRLSQVNLAAPVALASLLAEQEDLDTGVVVNLLDQKVANLNPDFFSYACTKVALEGATTMLAQALSPRVRVNAISPGLSLPSLDQTPEEFAAVASQNLLERPVSLDGIGAAVVYLMEAESVTGQNLFVDCGQRFVKRAGDVMFSTPGRRDG